MSPRHLPSSRDSRCEEEIDVLNHCCLGPCRVHVETGAFMIAVAGTLLCLLDAAANFATHNIPEGVVHLLEIKVFLAIFMAQRLRKHRLYLFYLIIELIALVLVLLFSIAIFLALSVPGIFNAFALLFPEGTDRKYIRNVLALMLLTRLLGLTIKVWFYSVIWRAYKFMHHQNTQQPPIA